MSSLEMRLRVAKKISELLAAECPTTVDGQFDALDAAHIIGLALGFGLANAPSTEAAEAMVKAYERGVEEAVELRRAIEGLGVKPS